MRTRTKVWLITAASLVLFGVFLFAGVMSTLKWDFTKLSTVKYETNTYEISEAFDRISINTNTADIVFAVADDDKCRVECHEEEKAKHSVTAEKGTLDIEVTNSKNWYDYIGINFVSSPKITVYLPTADYTSLFIHGYTGDIEMPKNFTFKDVDISTSTGDIDFYASASDMIKIKTSTGQIRTENISVGALDLSVSTGKVTVSKVSCKGDVTVCVSTGKTYLTDITCEHVISSGSTGDISLKNVIATQKITVERSTGDVILDGSDAAEISIQTDTGDVTGTLLSDKVFIAKTDTGRVDVPKSVSGGRCEVTSDTGNIRLKIQ